MVTARQLEALAAIDRLGAPSLRELGGELLVSHEAARLLVGSLRKAGALEDASGPRALVITPAGRDLLDQAPPSSPELPDAEHRTWRNRYVFAHARDAIRVWAAYRDGMRVDRARGGGSGGRTAAIEDVARVGRVLAGLTGPQLDVLIGWARGRVSQVDQRVRALVDRTTQRLQQLRIVARAGVRHVAPHRSTWQDPAGREHATTAFLLVAVDFPCDLDEQCAS
jgi:hypothetical protein